MKDYKFNIGDKCKIMLESSTKKYSIGVINQFIYLDHNKEQIFMMILENGHLMLVNESDLQLIGSLKDKLNLLENLL